MYICKNCKKQVNDGYVFCQYCGTPVDQNADQTSTVEEKEQSLESLSLALKETSEAMIREYVTGLKSMGVLLESTQKANQEKEAQISKLKEQLSMREQMASEYYNQLQNMKKELTSAQDTVKSLKADLNTLREERLTLQTASVPASAAEDKTDHSDSIYPGRCPVCGKPLDGDTVFCAYCGSRVDRNNADHTQELSVPQTKVLLCPHCNAEIDEDTVFCPSCGKRVI